MFRIALIFANVVLVNLVFLISFFLRYGANIPDYNFAPYKDSFFFLSFIYILAFAFAGLFRKKFSSLWYLFKTVFYGMFFGSLFSITFIYVFRIKWASFPSSVFGIVFITGLIVIYLANFLLLRANGKIQKITVVIGDGYDDQIVDNDKYAKKEYVHNVTDLIKYSKIDQLVICEKIHDEQNLNLLIYLLQKLKTRVFFAPLLYRELLSDTIEPGTSNDFLATFIGKRSDCEEFFIRVFDVILSSLFLFLTAPLWALIAILIKADSSGPVFYIQKRAGKDNKIFTMFKFRTMVKDADNMSSLEPAMENDPRVTRIGRLLRVVRLDELPQFINVLKGQMSLVGPRPENLHRIEIHRNLQGIRLAVKPGITGLAQIRSLYNLTPKHKVKYDYLYIQRRSLALNLYILIMTIPVIFSKKGW